MAKKPRLIYTFYRSHEVWPHRAKDDGLDVNVTVYDSMEFDQGCIGEFRVAWHDFGERGLGARLEIYHDAFALAAPALKALAPLQTMTPMRGWNIQTPSVDAVCAAFGKAGFIDLTTKMGEERRPS